MNLRAVKYQTVDLIVNGAGATVSSNNFTTDTNYIKVVAIKAKTNDAAKLASRGLVFSKFEIAGQEIYPSGFNVEDIVGDTAVAPNDRFDKDIDMPADGSVVNITVVDGSMTGQVYPYTVTITLKLTNPK